MPRSTRPVRANPARREAHETTHQRSTERCKSVADHQTRRARFDLAGPDHVPANALDPLQPNRGRPPKPDLTTCGMRLVPSLLSIRLSNDLRFSGGRVGSHGNFPSMPDRRREYNRSEPKASHDLSQTRSTHMGRPPAANACWMVGGSMLLAARPRKTTHQKPKPLVCSS